MNKLSQVAAHAIIILAVTASLQFVDAPGVQALHQALQPGGYAFFTLTAVAALHGYNGAAGIIFGVALLLAYPELQQASRYAVPVGIGVVTGNFARNILSAGTKEHRDGRPE